MNVVERMRIMADNLDTLAARNEAHHAARAVLGRMWADARHAARRSGSTAIEDLVSEAHEAAT